MIHIAYSADQQELARRIRDDLTDEAAPARPVLLALVSAQSNSDPMVQEDIRQAIKKQAFVIPVLTENVDLPDLLEGRLALNFVGGYHRRRLRRHLSPAMMTRDDVRQANRRALALIGGLALLMFGLAIFSLMRGLVAFPVDEYNEEATFQAQWIQGLIGETLVFVQPRSTADAVHFETTLQAAPTRLLLYIRETATALPARQGE